MAGGEPVARPRRRGASPGDGYRSTPRTEQRRGAGHKVGDEKVFFGKAPSRRAPRAVHPRSGASVVQSAISIKSWLQRLPTVEEARPATCPVCGAASCPVGSPLQLHGHGRRGRQVRGPGQPEEEAATVELVVRRYRCVPCGAVSTVVPQEILARRLYSVAAIGLALALWGLTQATAAQVRRRVSPAKIIGPTAVTGWATLRRWAQAVRRQDLFPSTPQPGPGATLRKVAASAAAALSASADPTSRGRDLASRAFFGAAQAA
jgi:hypothetical protein